MVSSSMEAKPKTAFTCSPVEVVRLGGRAW